MTPAARRISIILIILATLTTIVALYHSRTSQPSPATSLISPSHLPTDIYVWQRSWTPQVYDAIAADQKNFHLFVLLAAEITLRGTPRVAEVHPDYSKLTGIPIALAIRIGPLPAASADALNPDSPQTKLIRQTALTHLAAARAAGLNISELQIDFDCAESKLTGYANWITAVKTAIAPTPLIITALPAWLRHKEFADLAHLAGSYVLQVHSLHQPTGPDSPMTLCDPAEAQKAVQLASQIGVPFRVALPTYTYLAGFSPDGKLLGLSAEGPQPSWPTGTLLRFLRPDPDSLATLVRDWTTNPAPNMTGIIWYRMPVAGDSMNWRAATLHAVMIGQAPHANLQPQAIHTKPALIDFYLENQGNADADIPVQFTATWNGADIVASEAMAGFQQLDAPPHSVTFSPAAISRGRWIAPGEKIQIGWLRLSTDTEVQAHVISTATSSVTTSP